MEAKVQRELKLRVILERPPAGVDFGLQKGSGSVYETIEKQRSTGGDLTFECAVLVKTARSGSGPDFGGPFVQGPAGGRFVYIDIGTCAGQQGTPWSRRMKIPLSSIDWQMIDAGWIVQTRIPGTGKDGGPTCATVKTSWTLRQR
jgi:hypothetical protein